MGQYHQIVNLTDRSRLNPRAWGSSIKLLEFGHDDTGPMTGLILLLATEAWGGDRIAILGDYGEPEDLPAPVVAETGIDGSAYESPKITDVSADAVRLTLDTLGGHITQPDEYGFRDIVIPSPPTALGKDIHVCNLDKAQHLDPAAFGQARDLALAATTGGIGGLTTALAVLLACASTNGGRGGGDFHHDDPLVGSWAGDRLAVVTIEAVPDRSRDISPQIRDVLIAGDEAGYDVSTDGTVTKTGPRWYRQPAFS